MKIGRNCRLIVLMWLCLLSLTSFVLAVDLIVPAGTTQTIFGVHSYERAEIDGWLLLKGHTELTFTYGSTHTNNPDTNALIFGNSGRIVCDLPAGSAGTNGIDGPVYGVDGTDGSRGGDGQNGYNLSLLVYGDIYCEGFGYIILSGSSGGQGGRGGDGKTGQFTPWYIPGSDGGNGGRGGDGGGAADIDITCHGAIRTPAGYLHIANGGGSGGNGGAAGDGEYPNGVPGNAGAPGKAGNSGRVQILAEDTAEAVFHIYANGGGGGSGATGGDGSTYGIWGTPGTAASKGGCGGYIRVQTCELVQPCYFFANGGCDGEGGNSGEAGMGGSTVTYVVDGWDGGAGGDGGDAGIIEIFASTITNLTVEAVGGRGWWGGRGGDCGINPCGINGSGGKGGDGGAGGTVICYAPSNACDITYNLAGGVPGRGGYGESGNGCTPGSDGALGATGTVGSFTFEPVSPDTLFVGLDVNRVQARPGDYLVYDITVKTLDTPQTDVAVSANFSDFVSFVSASDGYVLNGDEVSWMITSLPECGVEQFQFTVQLDYDLDASLLLFQQATAQPFGGSLSTSALVSTRVIYEKAVEYGPDKDVPYTEDPVHPGIGNYLYHKQLFRLPAGTLPVTVHMTYNSQGSEAGGPLGYGWNHTYNIELLDNTNTATIRWGDSSEDYFFLTNGIYSSYAGDSRLSLTNIAGTGFCATLYNGVSYQFDTNNLLVYMQDRNQNRVTFSYEGSFLDQITDIGGRTVTFSYTGDLIDSISAVGYSATFDYDADSNLIAYADFSGFTNSFTYDASHRMLAETNSLGVMVCENMYDNEGRIAQQVNALGELTTFEYATDDPSAFLRVDIGIPGAGLVKQYYDANYNLIQVTDGEGQSAYFTYNDDQQRSGILNKAGRSSSCQYDTNGNPGEVRNCMDELTSVDYGSCNQPVSIQYPSGETAGFGYDGAGNMTAMSNGVGGVVGMTYTTRGFIETITDPEGRTWHLTWNTNGLIETATDPLGQTVTNTYDALGRLTARTIPGSSAKLQWGYDIRGNATNYIDAMGSEWLYAYDQNNNRIAVTFVPTTATTAYAYNDLNLVTNVTDPRGNRTVIEYDSAGRAVRMVNPLGDTTEMTYNKLGLPLTQTTDSGGVSSFGYDPNGNMSSLTNPLGNVWHFDYDERNMLVEVENPDGGRTAVEYDAMGRVMEITDPLGRTSRREYDLAGNPTNVIYPNGSRVGMTFSSSGKMTSLTDPNSNTWHFSYDLLDRLSTNRAPDGSIETYGYDPRNNMTRITLRDGRVIQYTYDLNNRCTSVILPDSAGTISNIYDMAGNLLRVMSPAGTNAMTYDVLNRITTYTDPFGNMISYEYTNNVKMAKITYPGSHVLAYDYDIYGIDWAVQDWADNWMITYRDAANNLTNIEYSSGQKTTYTYDPCDRLTGIRHAKSDDSLLLEYRYGYNMAGQVTSRWRQTAGTSGVVTAFASTSTYDNVNQLVSTMTPSGTNVYQYDGRGNLQTNEEDFIVTTFTYDPLDRLVAASDGAINISNTYDGLSHRIAKNLNGQETRYLSDGQHAYCRLNDANSVEAYNVYLGSLAYQLDAAGNQLAFHTDERGTVEAISDESENIVQSYYFSPFGQKLACSGSLTNEYQFVGAHGVTMEDNGLYRMGARHYDPVTGRFLSRDPIGMGGGVNLYAYANGNPVGNIDPGGLSPDPAVLLEMYEFFVAHYAELAFQATFETESAIEMGESLRLLDYYYRQEGLRQLVARNWQYATQQAERMIAQGFLEAGAVEGASGGVALYEGGAVISIGATAVILVGEFIIVAYVTHEIAEATGLNDFMTELFLNGMITEENLVNLEKYYQQQYKEEYEIADRADQKVKAIEDMPIYQFIMALEPEDWMSLTPEYLNSRASPPTPHPSNMTYRVTETMR